MSKGSDDLTFGQKVVGGLIGAINNAHVEVFNSHAAGGRLTLLRRTCWTVSGNCVAIWGG